MKKVAVIFFSLVLMVPAYTLAQQKASVLGWVKSTTGESLFGITAKIEGTSKGTATNLEGYFELKELDKGNYRLAISGVGYKSVGRDIVLEAGEVKELRITLENTTVAMSGTVTARSEAQIKRREEFAVASISAKPLQNSSANLDEVLNTNPGIHIRKEGGLGSRFNLSLNGLSGRQVRFYIDGLPLENYGSTFSLGNIPANLIERVEVFKGVVPIYLGGDALGGAVNLVTRNTPRHYLDASYSAGSFNTHKIALDGQYIDTSSGFVLKANGFYNHSDNNYSIDVRIPNPETGKYGDEQTVDRFHDAYSSRMIKVEGGFRDTDFADELLIGISLADNTDEVQHGVSMDRVFGRVHTFSDTKVGSFTYRKSINNLEAKAFFSYLEGNSGVVDTSAVSYNWLGEYEPKNNQNIAESSWDKTLFEFTDKAFQSNINLRYQAGDYHQFIANFTQNYISREGSDPASTSPVAFADPNILSKKVISGSYQLKLLDDRWATTIFSKLYFFNSEVKGVGWDDEVTNYTSDYFKPGYGLATTYHLTDGFQLKASYEKTYRFPDGYEVFGDGLLTLSNPELSPETSQNFNIGGQYDRAHGDHRFIGETNVFVRKAENLIRVQAQGITSQYVNQRNVVSSGVEAGFRYELRRLFFVDANLTYQNILNNTKYENGRKSHVYRDRLPNIPYLMSSQSLGIKFDDFITDQDRLNIAWRGNFVEEYFLKWPSLGSEESKYVIPRQYVQHVQIGYSLDGGRYNINLECANITDARAYDHFRLQKPGRSFQLKLRYLFN
ncbi:MAG: TonB-dependent receptor [Balneolaceae bacterium]|nr:TonB-dependent receptor [Balneolaceae bacterium]